MSKHAKGARHRVGRITVFEHHGGWWVYHRQGGKPVRRLVGESLALAECEASLLNAKFAADTAGIALHSVPAARLLAPEPLAQIAGVPLMGGATSPATTITLSDLRRAFLDHHEKVLHSSLATVSRYGSATLHLQTFIAQSKTVDPMQIAVPRFMEYLRSVEVSPNGHPNTAKRRLRDKGVRYVLECCRSLYHFGQRHGLLSKHHPNPFTEMRVGGLRIRDAKPVFVFNADQEIAFFEATNWWGFAVHFTCSKTGVRPGELAHMLIEDVDLKQGWLHIRSKPELGWTTKTSQDRRVPLIAEVVEVLGQVIGNRRNGLVFLREKIATARSLLLGGDRAELAGISRARLDAKRTEKGRPLSRSEEANVCAAVWNDAGAILVDRIRTSFIHAATIAGLAATCPKSWRHTFATLMQEANVDLLVRQETLGHKSSSPESSALGMTGVYTHTTAEFQRREIERALRLRPSSLALSQNLLQKERRRAAEELTLEGSLTPTNSTRRSTP